MRVLEREDKEGRTKARSGRMHGSPGNGCCTAAARGFSFPFLRMVIPVSLVTPGLPLLVSVLLQEHIQEREVNMFIFVFLRMGFFHSHLTESLAAYKILG